MARHPALKTNCKRDNLMSCFQKIILITGLARSGTTALHNKLDQHQQITSFGEVFHFTAPGRHYYKTWLDDNNIRASELLAIGSHLKIFERYVTFLLEETDAEYIVLDVKYPYLNCINSITHGLMIPPATIQLIKEHSIPVFHVIRRNLLRVYVSTEVSLKYNVWNVRKDEKYTKPGSISIDTDIMLKSLRNRAREIEQVNTLLAGHSRLQNMYYEEMYRSEGGFRDEAVDQIFAFLNLENNLDGESRLRKINKAPLSEIIENFDETIEALKGTEFENLIDDSL